jgi:transposase-like protein
MKKTKDSNMLSNFFKWKHYEGEIILLNVRWYLKYPLSYRNLKVTVDKNPAYPPAIDELKNDKILPKNVGIRQIKYLKHYRTRS